nr:uncharacterized protein CTRU02_13041 [Colletotrichum truncatum]KAF6783791.1 hypothetical protein CTRU02_13041 [Colletotrichum truncatum]
MASNNSTTLPHSGPNGSDGLPHDSRRPLLGGFMIAFTVIIIIFMCIRVYLRVYILKAWKLDDSMFTLSACITIAHMVPVVFGMTQGSLGIHIWDAKPEELKRNINFIMPSMLLHIFAFNTAKAVFLLQYRRAFAIRSVQLFCDVFLAVIFTIMAAMSMSGGILMSEFTKPNYVYGQNHQQFMTWSYVNACLNLTTDIVIFILPLPLVGRLRVAMMQKIGLIASFAVGIL